MYISDIVVFKGSDVEPPKKVTGLAYTVKEGKAVLTWNRAEDNTLTIWYRVVLAEDERETLAEVQALTVSLPIEKVHGKRITVEAVDFFENVSEPSIPVVPMVEK